MGGYIGARAGSLSTTTVANVQDVTATDTTPEVTIINNTHEDTDGGREGKVIFKGQQSGGEESTLAEIQGSHDGTADDQKGDLIFKTNDGSDNNVPTARSRIDSAGNFIFVHDANIGADPSVNNYLGISARATGHLDVSGPSAALDVNNRSGNGDIAVFRKGGTIVGAIGVANTDNLYIVNPETDTQKGIRLSDSQLVSCNTSGSSTDNELDLGGVSERFKDLYLGGGLHIGGTGAANKLEDYEEGTWTPTVSSGGATLGNVSGTAVYTKIGNFVHVQFYITSLASTTSSSFRLDGLPFANIANGQTVGSIMHQNVDIPGTRTTLVAYISSSGTIVRFYAVGDNTTWQELIGTNVGTSFNLIVNIQYRTS